MPSKKDTSISSALSFFGLILLLVGAVLVWAWQRHIINFSLMHQPLPAASTSTQPILDARGQQLLQLATNWRSDGDLGSGTRGEGHIPFEFPNQYDSGTAQAANVPASYVHLLSVPFHTDGRILRVYLGCTDTFEPQPGQVSCSAWETRLVTFDPKTMTSTFNGIIQPVSNANSGALYMPEGMTKDDKSIVLRAWMLSPGAGGGETDYGYATIPLQTVAATAAPITQFTHVATASAIFYDNFGQVVFVDEGDNTPHYSMPGPSNDAAIKYHDLLTGQDQTLLAETDTSYALDSLDESAKSLTFTATSYIFSKSCPRQEDALMCAGKSTSTRTIQVP